MTDALTLRLQQETETSLSVVQRGRFGYRYAYARSYDSKKHNDKGQDYLVLREDDGRLAFALCDGVSQSFYGDIAAKILGDALLDWLWGIYKNSKTVEKELTPVLRELVDQGQEKVNQCSLPLNIPPMVRDVLEKKRGIGSESTFAAGMLDIQNNKLAFVWMGDSRLRFWGAKSELTEEKLGETFLTRERWSSHKGLIGNLHGYVGALKAVRRVAVYSDGLSNLDNGINRFVTNEALSQKIAETEQLATSDDVSLLEIWLASKMPEARE